MKYIFSLAIVLQIIFCLLLSHSSESAITCSQVLKDLKPCVTYLVNGTGVPPSDCCVGVSALSSATSTSADKKTACSCIKSAAKSMNPNAKLAKDLPKNCGVTLSYSVSPDVDCSTVS